ncbi:MAG: N-acetyltransferase [Candidatus Hydrogenedens sp.]|nr:N-acetyltransferase [Candidatus Hydrogenedentota bacterium]NLF59397.1 N-acetyltransferase [Candidatus Hydrogenedens sp.]
MEDFNRIAPNVVLGEGVRLACFINAYGCRIGDRTKVGAFVEIQKNAEIGADCKISSHTFICEGVVIGDGVFIGHNVTFINDKYPRAVNPDGSLQTEADWSVEPTRVGDRASVGSSVTVLCGVEIGAGAMVGAGSVVTRSVPAGELWAGNPARFMRKVGAADAGMAAEGRESC